MAHNIRICPVNGSECSFQKALEARDEPGLPGQQAEALRSGKMLAAKILHNSYCTGAIIAEYTEVTYTTCRSTAAESASQSVSDLIGQAGIEIEPQDLRSHPEPA